MNLNNKNLLTPNEVMFLLIGIMMDISITALPNAVTAVSKQDGWISVIIGAAYPLYVALLAIYVSNKFPKENILSLSKRFLGKPIGILLNFFFLLSFFSYLPSLAATAGVIIRTDILPVITPLKLYVVFFAAAAYAATKGIKLLGRISTISFLMVVGIILPTIAILKEGSILNVEPVQGVSILNILKGAKATIYDYSLMELIFLIYPFINDSTKIKSTVLKTVGITCLIYTWITFITIYYMGINIIPKNLWSFITVTDGVKFQIITNFRYIFISFWIFIAAKSTSIFAYVCTFILVDIKKIKNSKAIPIVILAIVIAITLTFYKDYTAVKRIAKYISSISVTYNLFYITLITLLIWIKKEGANEKVQK